MSARAALAAGVVSALTACSVSTQGLAVSAQVQVAVTDSQGLGIAGPYGAVMAWVGGLGLEPVGPVPLAVPPPDGGSLATLTVEVPADFQQLDAGPIEILQLGPGISVYRPRVVVFQDSNGNGTFEYPGIDGGVGDRVLGVDGTVSIAYVPDVEGMLASLGATATDRYYAATGGLFTPYLPVFVDGNGAIQLGDNVPIPIDVVEGDVPREDLGCERSVSEDPLSLSKAFQVPGTYHVDLGLDATAICGGVTGTCVQEALTPLGPPALPPFRFDDHWYIVQCRQSGPLQSLLVFDARETCGGCTCNWTGSLDVEVAGSDALPPWWPCGNPLPYCAQAGSLLTVNVTCATSKG
jgi:hypothetical protein